MLHSTSAKEGNFVFPLYLYPSESGGQRQASLFEGAAEQGAGPGGRRANLSAAFIAELTARLGVGWLADGRGSLVAHLQDSLPLKGMADEVRELTIGPEDIFHYAYAVFHSPTYRSRYAEFLKIDFPRLPLTSDKALFAALAAKGAELVDLHLLRLPGASGVGGNGGATVLQSPGKQGMNFPCSGTNRVDKIEYHATSGRVSINAEQYFEAITPETWAMRVGGYQPLDKWLKDRKGRLLATDEVVQYMRMVIALRETRRLMAEIDALIPAWPLA